jgi:hypothetical protein
LETLKKNRFKERFQVKENGATDTNARNADRKKRHQKVDRTRVLAL